MLPFGAVLTAVEQVDVESVVPAIENIERPATARVSARNFILNDLERVFCWFTQTFATSAWVDAGTHKTPKSKSGLLALVVKALMNCARLRLDPGSGGNIY